MEKKKKIYIYIYYSIKTELLGNSLKHLVSRKEKQDFYNKSLHNKIMYINS